jgi:hypothetical protein
MGKFVFIALLGCAVAHGDGFGDFEYLGSGNSVVRGVAQRGSGDSNFIVVGRYWSGSQFQAILGSYLVSTGARDTGFGTSLGRRLLDFSGAGRDNFCNAVTYAYDGFIAACRSMESNGYYQVYLVKFNNSGTLDSGFGTSGIKATGVGGSLGNGQAMVNDIVYNTNVNAGVDRNGAVTIVGTKGSYSGTWSPYIATFRQDTGAQVGSTVTMGSYSGGAVGVAYDTSNGIYYVAATERTGNRSIYVHKFDNNLSESSSPWGTAKSISAAGGGSDVVPTAIALSGSAVVVSASERSSNSSSYPFGCTLVSISTASGNLNTSFGRVGITGGTSNQGASIFSHDGSTKTNDCVLNDVTSDGTYFYVGGTSYNGTNYDFVTAKLDSTGALVGAYGTSGIKVQAGSSGDDVVASLIFLSGSTSNVYGVGRGQDTTPRNGTAVVKFSSGGSYTAPSAPSDPSNVAVAASSGQNSVSWTASSSAANVYKVLRSSDGSSWSTVATVNADTTSYNDTSISTTVYAYKVRASNSAGDSSDIYPSSSGAFSCDSGSVTTTCTVSTAKAMSNNNLVFVPGHLTIASGGSITSSATQEISVQVLGTLTVQSGGAITANLKNSFAGTLALNSGGSISANGLGYAGAATNKANGTGPGAGKGCNSGGAGSGASYGGYGDSKNICISGGADSSTYGSASAPVDYGSGGAGASVSDIGTSGGGRIKISVNGTATIAGTLSANGTDATPATNYMSTGSGGSVWLIAGSLAGAGTISSRGGAIVNYGTAGGGGRIALYLGTTSFSGTVDVNLGAGDTVTGVGRRAGGNGTLYTSLTTFCDSGTLSGTCTVSSTKYLGGGTTISGSGSLVVASGGVIKTAASEHDIELTFSSGSITVQNGGSILANLWLATVTNFTIDSGGTVSANGLGYRAKIGTGKGGNATSGGAGGGGSYGGAGGAGATGGTAGSTYGSNTAPTDYGSGGGKPSSGIANPGSGNGGGRIKISASGTITVSGTLSANGTEGSGGDSGAGGSGGTVHLIAATLTGSGSVTANGGNGGSSGTAPGGGGGRIAIGGTNNLSGSVTANGGAKQGASGNDGSAGTVYYY